MTKWRKVIPIPPEYNGHGYLYECLKCHKVTTYLGGDKFPPWDCEHCNAEVEQQESEDKISRQAAINALLNKGQHSKRYKLGETWELNLMEIEETLEELPSVEPERKTGKWLWDKRTGTYHCSECGHDPLHESVGEIEEYKYCMNCGTRMEVDR